MGKYDYKRVKGSYSFYQISFLLKMKSTIIHFIIHLILNRSYFHKFLSILFLK